MLSPEQVERRRQGVGSSDVAAILGVSPFRTAFDVYLSKVEGFEPAGNFSQEMGDLLEPVVLALYERRTQPARLERGDELGTLVHPSIPWVLDTPDALAHFADGEVRPVEAKALRYRDDGYGDEGTDGIDEQYVCQATWHLMMQRALGRDARACDVPILFGASEFRTYRIEWDEEFAFLLLDRAGEWWHRHVLARVPPSMDESRNAAEWLKSKFRNTRPELLDATDEQEIAAANLRAAVMQADEAERRLENERNRWRQWIAEAAGIQTGLGAVTWKADKNGKRTFRTPKHWRKSDE